MEWLYELLSRLSHDVNLGNPTTLGVLYALGIVGDIGFPLLFTVEMFLFFTSYNIGPLSSQALLIVLMLLLGRETGAALLYWVSRTLGRPLINRIGRRFPRLLDWMERVSVRISRHSVLSVAVVRLTPGMLQIPSLVAGIMPLRYLEFTLGVALSSLAYDVVMILLGLSARFGLRHLQVKPETYLIAGFIIFIAVVWITLYLVHRHGLRRQRNREVAMNQSSGYRYKNDDGRNGGL
jgi:membrane protein DedA with SNARE-associated domain